MSPNWLEQLEIIKNKISANLSREGQVYSRIKAESWLGISRGKMQAWEKGQRPSADDLELIADKLGLSPAWLLCGKGEPEEGGAPAPAIRRLGENAEAVPLPDQGVLVTVHAMTGAGAAYELWEPQPLENVYIPPEFWGPNIMAMRVAGDSMSPLIRKDSLVGVNTDDRRYVGGEVYAVRVPYEGMTVKRVFVDGAAGVAILRSDNPIHPELRLPLDEDRDYIVGRVVWVMQMI